MNIVVVALSFVNDSESDFEESLFHCVNNGAKIIKLLQRSEQISESDGWIDIVDGNRRYGGRCVVGVFVFIYLLVDIG